MKASFQGKGWMSGMAALNDMKTWKNTVTSPIGTTTRRMCGPVGRAFDASPLSFSVGTAYPCLRARMSVRRRWTEKSSMLTATASSASWRALRTTPSACVPRSRSATGTPLTASTTKAATVKGTRI